MSTADQAEDAPPDNIGSYVYGIMRSGQRIPDGLEPVPHGSDDAEPGLGLVGPVRADAGALGRPIGRIAIAGASAGEVAAVVLLSVGLVIFTTASLFCGLATSYGLLVSSRAIQGVGGAAIFATALAMAT